MRIQFSSIPSGSITSVSRRRCSGSGIRTACFFSFAGLLRSYDITSFSASFAYAFSSGSISRPSKSILHWFGSWGMYFSVVGFQNLRLYQASWSVSWRILSSFSSIIWLSFLLVFSASSNAPWSIFLKRESSWYMVSRSWRSCSINASLFSKLLIAPLDYYEVESNKKTL